MPSPLPILFSDESLLVIDKPAGILSIPDRWDPEVPDAVSELRVAWGKLFVVHRLDKDTSGVLIFARSPEAHKSLSEAFESRSVSKAYRALVRGSPAWDDISCDLALMPDGDKLHRTLVSAHHGKKSLTAFVVIARYKDYALVEARPETGRTHQVRVHLASVGHPCLCDPLYGDKAPVLLSKLKRRWRGDPFDERPLLARTALHALSAEFSHPVSGAAFKVEAPLPKDMRATIAQLEKL
jgi:tRNA pseudouridine32 synthase/23S rRNA pseudouridine746 synthase